MVISVVPLQIRTGMSGADIYDDEYGMAVSGGSGVHNRGRKGYFLIKG